MAARPTVAITDSDLASTEDERVLREAGLTAVRLQASTEDGLIAALSRLPADALIVQWAPVTAAVLDPHAAPAPGGDRLTSLEDLLRGSHLVTLHAPLTPETRHLIRADTIGLMPPGALLVNTCRGGLIDEAAVAAALRAGRLAGAAMDVFETEPLPADSPLRSLPNVLLSPHAAWYSKASLAALPVRAAQQVVDFLGGLDVPSIVNPEYLGHVAQRRLRV